MAGKKQAGKKGKKKPESKKSNVRRHRTKRPGRDAELSRELSKETNPCLRKLRKAILTFGLKKS